MSHEMLLTIHPPPRKTQRKRKLVLMEMLNPGSEQPVKFSIRFPFIFLLSAAHKGATRVSNTHTRVPTNQSEMPASISVLIDTLKGTEQACTRVILLLKVMLGLISSAFCPMSCGMLF
jgi:hypothetical protein